LIVFLNKSSCLWYTLARGDFMNKEKIVFMGTADFSEAVLTMLINQGYQVEAVVTQPDRPVGRKRIVTPSLVKQLALKHNIKVLQPDNIKKDYQEIIDLQPDLIITAAYGQLIPEVLLNTPRLGCVNVHASLLPKLRGGAPVHYAIINGEKETGVTIMYMAKKMDAGDIISSESITINDDETVGTLYRKLTQLGASLLIKTLPSILEGTNQRIKQDQTKATFAYTITRDQEMIDWNKSAQEIDCFIRGLNPWPVASTTYLGDNIKLFAGKVHDCENASKHHADNKNGEIIKILKDAIGIKVNEGVFLITELQLAGKKRMTVQQILNGKKDYFKVGEMFR